MRISPELRRRVPGWAKPAARAAVAAADPLARARARRATGHEGPIPPYRLRARIGSAGAESFLRGGERLAGVLTRALRDNGVAEDAAVLDFGCGCGRLLTHVQRLLPGARLHGCDVDGPAIAWCARHLDGIAVEQSSYAPPLPYPDDSFDALYSMSIFTHLPAAKEEAWLAELARVLRPGGLALVSVAGEHLYERFRAGDFAGTTASMLERLREHGPLGEEGFVYEAYDDEVPLRGIEHDQSYGLAFHDLGALPARWSGTLDVERVAERAVNGFQDLVHARPARAD